MTTKNLKELSIKQFPSGTIFKIGFICNISLWGIIGLILGIMAASGYDVVSWNGAYIHGIGAIFVALLICAVFAICGSVLLMLGGMLGSRLLGSTSLGTLSYIVDSENE